MIISEEALYNSDLYAHYLDTVIDGGFISSLADTLNTFIDLYDNTGNEHVYEISEDIPEEVILNEAKKLMEVSYNEITCRIENGYLYVGYNTNCLKSINYLKSKYHGEAKDPITNIGIL